MINNKMMTKQKSKIKNNDNNRMSVYDKMTEL